MPQEHLLELKEKGLQITSEETLSKVQVSDLEDGGQHTSTGRSCDLLITRRGAAFLAIMGIDKVKCGDRIVEVAGVTGDADTLLDKIDEPRRGEEIVKLVVWREPAAEVLNFKHPVALSEYVPQLADQRLLMQCLGRLRVTTSEDLFKARVVHAAGLDMLLCKLDSALVSQAFFQSQLRALEGLTRDRDCAICLEDKLPIHKLSITRCAHLFCTDCIKSSIITQPICPQCRSPSTARDISALPFELAATPAANLTTK